MSDSTITQFISLLNESLDKNNFVRLVLVNRRDKSSMLKSASAKVISIKKGLRLSFVLRHETKDITENYTFAECGAKVEALLLNDFTQADLFTLTANHYISIARNGEVKLRTTPPTETEKPTLSHDKEKVRLISAENKAYLHSLGITTADGKVKMDMQDKYRQINKYVEIIDGVLKSVELENTFSVADMGAGKGYLTFALYDYLVNVLHKTPNMVGVELRKELVDKCNAIAKESGFTGLSFAEGTIMNTTLPKMDMLIALHACDTATDDAIYRGMQANAKVIICAPCCHKQIRKQMNPTGNLHKITQFGILKERQAELLTDGLRALIMEAYGYKTNVFEFIATEHTPKNVLIVGVKQREITTPDPKILEQIADIKRVYGIEYHHLEKLLGL